MLERALSFNNGFENTNFSDAAQAGFTAKESAHDRLEEAGSDYVHRARDVAYHIYLRQGFVTVDDVRAVLPPPKSKDTRVMGAIFRKRDGWLPTGTTPSKRKECHGRPIQRFVFMKEEVERAF